jgi:hypothetical protein
MFAVDKMSEAEVSLRLAFHLLDGRLVIDDVSVAIDGAQVRTAETVHFHIEDFLRLSGCESDSDTWRGAYHHPTWRHRLLIHAHPGRGDVVARLTSGQTLRVESKKGPLVRKPGAKEYPLLREALGQLLTIEEVGPDDILAVAVPHSPKFVELTRRWERAPLIQRLGIGFLLVHRSGAIDGTPLLLRAHGSEEALH